MSDVTETSHSPNPLTTREFDVLRLMAAGHTNREIAALLVMSVGTIRWYTKRIYAKLGVHTHTQAVLYAGQRGLLAVRETNNVKSDNELPIQGKDITREVAGPPALSMPPTKLSDIPGATYLLGRTAELAAVRKWIVDEGCRMVIIHGMGGQGKTALAVSFTRSVVDEFDFVIWHSLHNAPSLHEQMQSWLRILSDQQIVTMPQHLDAQFELLFSYLRRFRCLIVLDNAESIMRQGEYAGEYLPGYENYGLLERQFGESEHRSCLLLTSRELPRRFSTLERDNVLVHSLKLSGLSAEASSALLRLAGLSDTTFDTAHLVTRYSGNPLALKLVANAIRQLHDGDIGAFLANETPIFDDIQDILQQQFERLSALEQDIMYWLAVERESTTIETLRQNLIQQVTHGELLSALLSLQRRSLVEKCSDGFALQNVLLEYVGRHLVQQACLDITLGKLGFINRFAFMKAQSREYVRLSQKRIILGRIADCLLDHYGRNRVESHIKTLIESLRKATTLKPGYAGGNILNLMLHLHMDSRGCDFSGLPVWQIYAHDESLTQVNFSNSDLSGSVFADTFSNILSIAFSPNGQLLAMRTGDEAVRVLQVSSGRLLMEFITEPNLVWPVLFSADGHSLISCGADTTMHIWDIDTGQIQHVLRGHSGRIWTAAISFDGHTLATGSEDQSIRMWDVCTGQAITVLTGHTAAIHGVAFSPDGRRLISGAWDNTVRIWDLQGGQSVPLPVLHTKSITSVAFSPDNQHVATGSADASIEVWNVASEGAPQLIGRLQKHKEAVCSIAFNADGRLLASGGADQLTCIWDVPAGCIRRVLTGHTGRIQCVVFNPVNDILASGGWDKTLCIWDAATGHLIRSLHGIKRGIRSVVFSPDGEQLVSSGDDPTIWLWAAEKPGVSDTIPMPRSLKGHSNSVHALAYSPEGNLLVSSGSDKTIQLWDMASHVPLNNMRWHTHDGWLPYNMNYLAFSPDGTRVASGGNNNLIPVWDIRSGHIVDVFQGHDDIVRSVAFSRHGEWLISGSDDRTIRQWDLRSGNVIRTFTGHTHGIWTVSISPDNVKIASGGEDHTIRLWDVPTGQVLHILYGHKNSIYQVAFSPDGALLASCSEDHTICIWDTNTGELIHHLMAHRNPVWCLAFDPRGTVLVSGSADETLHFWDVRTGTCFRIQETPKLYAGMSIQNATGLSTAQRVAVRTLGALS